MAAAGDEEKLEALAEVFEKVALTPAMELDALGWDSMAMLSVMALARMRGKAIAPGFLRSATTVSDLLQAI